MSRRLTTLDGRWNVPGGLREARSMAHERATTTTTTDDDSFRSSQCTTEAQAPRTGKDFDLARPQ